MKLLDVLKKYDRCVVRESAKLTKIYKSLLKENEIGDDTDKACPYCNQDPCICDTEVDETEDDEAEVDETEMVPAKEFFAEDDEAEVDETENVEEKFDQTDDEISAEKFFAEGDEGDEDDKPEKPEDKNKNKVNKIKDSEENEKKLEESLKSYRRINHRLFNA